ncbi:predicted protein [Plenodomus lingam JN3]|uniref:Predicted protein n=1 Tax=Leptosphaeria maculans (strain JN3 / isolate v23.1.3 / race Av1-4-5-6-7-8) TaxID=985895 RepID=E5A1T7_LEPMJ|nr:predicted protein [Plenodomus lingam JN3]CBX97654.1 predicted protein [Plenodomus lingam JN3]
MQWMSMYFLVYAVRASYLILLIVYQLSLKTKQIAEERMEILNTSAAYGRYQYLALCVVHRIGFGRKMKKPFDFLTVTCFSFTWFDTTIFDRNIAGQLFSHRPDKTTGKRRTGNFEFRLT